MGYTRIVTKTYYCVHTKLSVKCSKAKGTPLHIFKTSAHQGEVEQSANYRGNNAASIKTQGRERLEEGAWEQIKALGELISRTQSSHSL